jgi:hypothetical protein
MYGIRVEGSQYDPANEERVWGAIKEGRKVRTQYILHDTDFYIGRDLSSMDPDETRREFEEGVEATLKKFFGEDIHCYLIEGGWYDG